jgi:nucleoside 2-deoxyribosyltransferase
MKNKIRVYLAGGFHSAWAKRVQKECGDEDFTWMNPIVNVTPGYLPLSEQEKEERSKKQRQCPWWPQDRLAIQKSDIIFANLEDYRPNLLGTGNIFELGMAYAWSKLVILVNQIEHRYYREFEHLFISFKTLGEGIEFLKKCYWLK